MNELVYTFFPEGTNELIRAEIKIRLETRLTATEHNNNIVTYTYYSVRFVTERPFGRFFPSAVTRRVLWVSPSYILSVFSEDENFLPALIALRAFDTALQLQYARNPEIKRFRNT